MLPTSKAMDQCTSSLQIHWWRCWFVCCSSMDKVALTWYFYKSDFTFWTPDDWHLQNQFINVPRASRYIDGMLRDATESLGASMNAKWGEHIRNNIDECLKDGFETKGTSTMLREKGMKTTSMNLHRDPKVHRWTFLRSQKYIDELSWEPKSTSMNVLGNPKVHRLKFVRYQNDIDESWFGNTFWIHEYISWQITLRRHLW